MCYSLPPYRFNFLRSHYFRSPSFHAIKLISFPLQIIGDVRGKGLMIAIEMVEDKATKTPLAADRMGQIWESAKDMKVLLGKGGLVGNIFRIKPPMCISRQDADFALEVFREAVKNCK